jgi:antitoxin component YwqK of YwqJK toxin-antitoxin module
MSLVSFPSWGLTMDDLVEREGIFYKEFSDVPFTGEVDEGWVKGSFVNGMAEGLWKSYEGEDQLESKGNYKNGQTVGVWEYYFMGYLESKGTLTDDQEQGFWETYYENGQVESNGNCKNGKLNGSWEDYWGIDHAYAKGYTVDILAKWMRKIET